MAKYSIEEQTLDNIANAILAKTGSSTALTPEQMPTAIADIEIGESVKEPYAEYVFNETGDVISATLCGFEKISKYEFYNRPYLSEVDFSRSPNITSIENYAFDGCSNLVA